MRIQRENPDLQPMGVILSIFSVLGLIALGLWAAWQSDQPYENTPIYAVGDKVNFIANRQVFGVIDGMSCFNRIRACQYNVKLLMNGLIITSINQNELARVR